MLLCSVKSSTVTLYSRPSTVILNFRSMAISFVVRLTLGCARMKDSMRTMVGGAAFGLPALTLVNRLDANDAMLPDHCRDSGRNDRNLRVRQGVCFIARTS